MGWIHEARSPSLPCLAPSLTALLGKLSDKLGWIDKKGSPSAQCLAKTS